MYLSHFRKLSFKITVSVNGLDINTVIKHLYQIISRCYYLTETFYALVLVGCLFLTYLIVSDYVKHLEVRN